MAQRPNPVQQFLARLDRALGEDRVVVLEDARDYAIRDFGWEIEDIFAFLYVLDAQDFSEHVPSTAPEGGTIWIFLPMSATGRIWVRLCERNNIYLLSFHRG
ncbi:MAG TPA: hypothetical protein PKY30_02905 [Myxococcota bacterium]|nr:hypothetical protein [Myxococcota bacterium]HND33526.1 hypothetical protein [Myxococcota bacterium]HNH45956.1 hypothetical protein [Myxococcota bacterium]